MSTPTQRDEAWFKAATAEEKAAAHDAGELVDLLTTVGSDGPYSTHSRALSRGVDGRAQRPRSDTQRDEAWTKSAAAEQVAKAFDAGELEDLLGGTSA